MNDALSKFYGQPVVAGYTNGGWPVVRPAGNPDAVVAGGMGGEIAPAVVAVIAANAALESAVAYLLE